MAAGEFWLYPQALLLDHCFHNWNTNNQQTEEAVLFPQPHSRACLPHTWTRACQVYAYRGFSWSPVPIIPFPDRTFQWNTALLCWDKWLLMLPVLDVRLSCYGVLLWPGGYQRTEPVGRCKLSQGKKSAMLWPFLVLLWEKKFGGVSYMWIFGYVVVVFSVLVV